MGRGPGEDCDPPGGPCPALQGLPPSTGALFCQALWIPSGSHSLRAFRAETLPLAVVWVLLFIGTKSAESPTSTGGLEGGGG